MRREPTRPTARDVVWRWFTPAEAGAAGRDDRPKSGKGNAKVGADSKRQTARGELPLKAVKAISSRVASSVSQRRTKREAVKEGEQVEPNPLLVRNW